ncbi:hypothetical protein OK414_14690 [Priestia sp. JV24]|uniref:hypothetical protein n=1 Tax=Priestia TaxID=2800373 RepID=UPI0021D66C94|nr:MULTISPECIES: hypothetical protein [Priestia]MCU7712464.1 hypothetical protein [Priestia megaterium]MCW1046293.1 hypothetical protein [Priestia sp. JV24]
MARQSKIEKYGCEEIVFAGLKANPPKSTRQIAEECSEQAGVNISHTAVARYIESTKDQEQRQRKEVIKEDKRRVMKVVNQEFDIIQLQYKTTERLLARFELVDDLPEYFDQRMDDLKENLLSALHEGGEIDYDYLDDWKASFNKELKRKVYEITTLNKELRENTKFLVDLREKAFEFSLIQEYLSIFMDKFRDVSEEGYEVAIQHLAANPRMQKIVDQHMQLRGEA